VFVRDKGEMQVCQADKESTKARCQKFCKTPVAAKRNRVNAKRIESLVLTLKSISAHHRHIYRGLAKGLTENGARSLLPRAMIPVHLIRRPTAGSAGKRDQWIKCKASDRIFPE
jgi:hypothetical protein